MQGNIERQEDEIEALKSMYVSDFTDLRKDNVWKKKSAPEIKIRFRPQSRIEDECHMEVTLYINCPLQYPDKIPVIRLENPVGFTNQELDKLKTDLEEQMKTLVGEVMILELALTVQTFLNDHIRPAPKSFYEEMLSHKQKQEEKYALEQERRNEMIKQREEKERRIIEEEIAKRFQTRTESIKQRKSEDKNEDYPRRESLKESQKLLPINTTKDDKNRSLSPETEGGNSGKNSDVLESESIVFGMVDDSKNLDDDAIPYYKPFGVTNGHSRLSDDFEHIMSLGKGGFGDVLKVRNKLDGRFYAIKRIPLNPNSQQFTKKITREVKLLSRLNHENVVRYYNSWIEVSEKPSGSETSSSLDEFMDQTSSTPSKPKPPSQSPPPVIENSLGLADNIENLAPPIAAGKSVEWSVEYSSHHVAACESDSEDENSAILGSIFPFDEDDDDDDVIFDDDDDEVKIQRYQTSSKNLLKKSEKKENITTVSNEDNKQIQYLFIQMEYCEKSTLRNCIDAGLYKEIDRVWRLFREIIEGLNHLHDQGIIHRDLKPVNIFLDMKDHVKIGDFGLATTDILVKKSIGATKQSGSLLDADVNYSTRSNSMGDTELTGNVGTALYVSPEVMATGGKFHYNQKVDSYSLGIIFFEMSYKPLTTGMERIAILNDLRSPGIKFPPDFQDIELEQQTMIIKWLLNHDPNSRPTTKELLRSDLLPPLQMEEATMNELFRSTISNPQSRSYHRLVDALFSQPFSVVQDRTYDSDTCKPFSSPKLHLIQKSVCDTIEKVFQYHGAIKFSTPLLMPKSHLYESNEQYACFVDHSGGLVGLPCDQRVPFARFIARSNTQSMKRYCLDKVYQEKKFFGLHPKDMTECAFDIVTPSHASLIPESELLAVSSQVIHEFPILRERNYYFRLNHTSLVKAVLFFCGIREEKHHAVQLCLRDFQHKKAMRRQSLESKCCVTFTEHSAANFFTLLDFEGSYSKVNNLLRPVVKSKGQASSLAKQGLHELETIINYAESLDVKLEIKVTVGLIYNPTQYDGFIFQVLYEHRKKKRLLGDVLAAGGRYEKLIRKFKVDKDDDCGIPSAVGVSLAFEKIVSAVLETAEVPSSHDIVVCSVGHKTMLKERLRVVKELWSAGLRAEVFYDSVQNLEEVHMYCRNYDITYIVCLKDGDGGSVRIRWMEKDKNMEKKVFMVEMVEFLQQKLSASKIETNDVPVNRNSGTNNQSSSHIESHQSSNVNGRGFNFIFINQDMKLPGFTRRRHETQIFGKVTSLWPWLPGKSLDVIAFNLDSTVLKTLACYLEINEDEETFENSISTVIEKLLRHKKYLVKIIDEIHHLKFEKKVPYFVIYGLKDDSIRLMT